MHIGAKIRQLRRRQRLTQQDIEAKTGVMKCHISLIENGHRVPALKTVERITEGFEGPLVLAFLCRRCSADPFRAVSRSRYGGVPGRRKRAARTGDSFPSEAKKRLRSNGGF
jgi:transcriptional regulator with XRE-family HTH domain